MKITTLNQPTMSSREIAELTGKHHDNVMEDIRKMLEELELAPSEFLAELPDAYGHMQPAFALPKRECQILVSGYSTTQFAWAIDRVLDRWKELETQVAQPAATPPATPPAMPASVEALMFAEVVARMLRLEGSAALGMIRKATEITAPHLLPMLPAHVISTTTPNT